MIRIAVLITAHNRRRKTVECISKLICSSGSDFLSIELFVVDDGSTDGTHEAVRVCAPSAHIIRGTGDLYWNGGMRRAFEAAQVADPDYFLWLNDDTVLFADTLRRLVELAECERKRGHEAIVVGVTRGRSQDSATYGGVVRTSWWRPLKFELLPFSNEPQQCDTMHGNCVLIHKSIAAAVGNLERSFIHTMGDIDYGLRARKLGYRILTLPGCAGICDHNSTERTYIDHSLPLRTRWNLFRSVKSLPPRQWYIMARRHSGPLWPLFWIWPYIRFWFRR